MIFVDREGHALDGNWQRLDATGTWSRSPEEKSGPGIVVVDPRRYRRHRGYLLRAERIYLGPVWTPLVRVHTRLPRASDGGTEI